jgi:ABC-type antimicrobial peptide transport system permease subunit
MTWAMIGIALGVAVAFAGGRLLAGALYGVTPQDATTYAGVVLGLLVVVAIACLIPASRATHADPLASMRSE